MTSAAFRPHAAFTASHASSYQILPFRFLRWDAETVLLTNDVGEYAFLPRDAFQPFVANELDRGTPEYGALKGRHFLTDAVNGSAIDLLATKYRTKKSFLQGFTGLHLFVVTLRCDHTCAYCQVSRVTEDRDAYDMTQETATAAIELMLQTPHPALKVEFQGGEPLLNFELIRFVVTRVRERCEGTGRKAEFVVTTNLSRLEDGVLAFMKEHAIQVSTSLDGPAFIHDTHRVRRGGNSHATTVRNLARARDTLGPSSVSALMTTSPLSLGHPKEIVDEYVRQGFHEIFLRYQSPYGFAVRGSASTRYATEAFIRFYREALTYIIELNRNGVPILEVYTQLLLRRILTPFTTGYVDLQSPSGAGMSVVVYNYNGAVYATDESRMLAEMGDESFRLGTVHDAYADIFGGPVVRALANASVLETMPGCSECAFNPYCGADPIFHWATQGDALGHRPTSAFCSRQMAIFRHLFGLIRDGDDFVRRLFARWAAAEAQDWGGSQ